MEDKFYALTVLVKRLKRMPVKYKDFSGRVFETYYTTHELLSRIVLGMSTDSNTEKRYRECTGSLKEIGFKKIALFINKSTGESIAILGI